MKINESRNYNLDFVRIFAFFSVVSIHYFLYSDFYVAPVLGIRMFIMTIIRNFFMICVPLFIVLTGYLMAYKKLNRAYFLGIKKTLIIYILASVLCLVFKKYYLVMDIDFKSIILSILDFTGANYAWYINMYIGLFLIIPFLNNAYMSLKSKKQKQCLIFIMMLLSIFPTISNIFHNLLPNYWTGLYPISYYFIGVYLRDEGLNISWKRSCIYLVIVNIISSLLSIWYSKGGSFVWGDGMIIILYLHLFQQYLLYKYFYRLEL